MREVLTNPTYRDNAKHLREEIAPIPGLEYGVDLLERLAAQGNAPRSPAIGQAPV